MKKYTVYIEEKLIKGTEIEANSIEEAEAIAQKMYHAGEIVLTADNQGTDAEMQTDSLDGTESTEWHTF